MQTPRNTHTQHQVQGHEHRHGMEDMLSVEEAYKQIMACFGPLAPEERPILKCLGQVLSNDIHSPLDLPPIANSAMDGYAVRHEDISGASPGQPRQLKVIGLIAAGQMPSQNVVPGCAIRIMTGAPIPIGSDLVVPFEDTDEIQRQLAGLPLDQVAIRADLPAGCNVRPSGEDVRRGQLVLHAGTAVRPAEIGVMASLGLVKANVIRRPVVSILSTGDELTDLGHPLEASKIYDSNRFGIAASVIAHGGVVRQLGISQDNRKDLNRKIMESAGSDLLISSGGVSKGDYDIVKEVLTQNGDINFWSVRIRPAKPIAFGTLRGIDGQQLPFLGLPGNPVSAMVAFEIFARPAILAMLGHRQLERPTVMGILTEPIYNHDKRRVYTRVDVEHRDRKYFATPTGPQGSNILTSMSRANGLAICPAEVSARMAGEEVQIIMLDWNKEVII
jgi:molybdopterin molybdotransferase